MVAAVKMYIFAYFSIFFFIDAKGENTTMKCAQEQAESVIIFVLYKSISEYLLFWRVSEKQEI